MSDFVSAVHHQFKKLGAVAVTTTVEEATPVHFEAPQSATHTVIRRHANLVACSRKYGWVFFPAPGHAGKPETQGFWMAQADGVCKMIEADRAAAEEESKEKGEEASRVPDVPIQEKVFTFVSVQSPMWHLSLNATNDLLLVCTATHLMLYSVHALANKHHAPLASLEMDQPVLDAVWSHNPRYLEIGVLMADRTFRVYGLRLDDMRLQCQQAFGGDDAKPVGAVTCTDDRWVLGFADGSLLLLAQTNFADSPVEIQPHQPADVDATMGIYSLQYMHPSALIVGMYQLKPESQGDETKMDPEAVHVATFNTVDGSWGDFGDVLRENERFSEDESDKLYQPKHRFFAPNLSELRLSVFASNKGPEVLLFGVDPTVEEAPDRTWPIQPWIVGDSESDQIVVPMDADYKETYVLGIDVDTTNRQEYSGARYPVIFMLTTDARLLVYYLTTQHPPHVALLPELMQPAKPVPAFHEVAAQADFVQYSAAQGQEEEIGDSESQESEEGEVESEESQPVTPQAAPPAKPDPQSAMAALAGAAADAKPAFNFASSTTKTSEGGFILPPAPSSVSTSSKDAQSAFQFGTAPSKGQEAAEKPAFSFGGFGGPQSQPTAGNTAAPAFGTFTAPSATAAAAQPSFGGGGTAFTFSTSQSSAAPTAPAPRPPSRSPEPAASTVAPPPAEPKMKKNLTFSPSPELKASSSPPLQPAAVSMGKSAAADKPSGTTMTRSILKQSPPPPPVEDPYAASKFSIDYRDQDAASAVPSAQLRPAAKFSVDPDPIRATREIGTTTEKSFMEALIGVAKRFADTSLRAAQCRELLIKVQQPPPPGVVGFEKGFNLSALRTLSSRTRRLSQIAAELQSQLNSASDSAETLVSQGERDLKIYKSCEALLRAEQDPEYRQLRETMPLDVHSAKFKQSIEQRTQQVQIRIQQLESHLQELYTQFHATSSSAAVVPLAAGVNVPTVKSVVSIVNSHGRKIEELEDALEEIKAEVAFLEQNPPAPSKELRRAMQQKRQIQLRQAQQQHPLLLQPSPSKPRGADTSSLLSPIARMPSGSSGASTPIYDEEAKEEHFGSTAASPLRGRSVASPGYSPAGTGGSFSRTGSVAHPSLLRASSLSTLSSAFYGKLAAQSKATPARPSLSREASVLALNRGKSKQKLDQLFAEQLQMEQQTAPEEPTPVGLTELAHRRLSAEHANTRRWARTASQTHAVTRPSVLSPSESPVRRPAAFPAGGESSEDEEERERLDEMISLKPSVSKETPKTGVVDEEEKKEGKPPTFSLGAPAATTNGAAAFSFPAASPGAGFGAFSGFGASSSAATTTTTGKPADAKPTEVASSSFSFASFGTKQPSPAAPGTEKATPTTDEAKTAAEPAMELKPRPKAKEKQAFDFALPAAAPLPAVPSAAAADKGKVAEPAPGFSAATSFSFKPSESEKPPPAGEDKKEEQLEKPKPSPKPTPLGAETVDFNLGSSAAAGFGGFNFGSFGSTSTAANATDKAAAPPGTAISKIAEKSAAEAKLEEKTKEPQAAAAKDLAAAPAAEKTKTASPPAAAAAEVAAAPTADKGKSLFPPAATSASSAPAFSFSSFGVSSASASTTSAAPSTTSGAGGLFGSGVGFGSSGFGGFNFATTAATEDKTALADAPAAGKLAEVKAAVAPAKDAAAAAPAAKPAEDKLPEIQLSAAAPSLSEVEGAADALGGLAAAPARAGVDADEVKTQPSSPVRAVSASPGAPEEAVAPALPVAGTLAGDGVAGGGLGGFSLGGLGAALDVKPPGGMSLSGSAATPAATGAGGFGGLFATPATTAAATAPTAPPANIFGSSSGGSTLFGSSLNFSTAGAAMTGAAVAGASTSNLFSQPASSLFPATATPATGNLFAAQPTNLFGTSSGQQPGAPGGPAATGATTNLFAQTGSSNLFGAAPAAGGLFATASNAGGALAGSNVFGNVAAPAAGGATATFSNLFGSGGAAGALAPSSGPFGTASGSVAPGGPFASAQPAVPAAAGPFGATRDNPIGSQFGRPSFGAAPSQALPAQSGFGGNNAVAQLAFGGGMGGIGGGIGGLGAGPAAAFGSSAGAPVFGSSVAPAAGGNIFGAGAGAAQQAFGAGSFGGAGPAPPGSSPFGALAKPAGAQPFGSGFGAAAGGGGGFGALAQQPPGGGFGGFGGGTAAFGATPQFGFDTNAFRG